MIVMTITPHEVGAYLLTLIGPIIIGIVVAGFTANFALKRFHREKWWEKRHAAYGELVDILIEMESIYASATTHHDRIYRAEQTLSDVPDYHFDWAPFGELKKKLRRSVILAPISLSHKTEALLTEFFMVDASSDEMIHEEGYPEVVAYSEMVAEVENLIILIVNDARNELKFN